MSAKDTTLLLVPSNLSDHPLLAHIPTWKRDEPEFIALVESIRDHGQDYDALIDSEQRVVDGRNRRNACAVLKIKLRCRPISDGDAASVIVASMVNRRNLTKGSLAYLSAPLFQRVIGEAKARRIANLKHVGGIESALSADSIRNGSDIAAAIGIGTRLFEQAMKLRAMFDEMGEDVREKYEHRVLGPWEEEDGELQDPVGLGYMINGLTSLADDARKKKNLGKRAQHDRLFAGLLPKFSLHWKKANADQREQIATRLKADVLKWPDDLRDELAAAIRAAKKAEKE